MSGTGQGGIWYRICRLQTVPRTGFAAPARIKVNSIQSLIVFVLLALFVPVASQAQALDLYSGSVPVEDQSPSAREAAFPQALGQVLGKLSGLRDLEAYPGVAPAVQSARTLVVSFHYQQVESDVPQRGAFDAQSDERPAATHLVARFSHSGVDALMRDLGLPRWPPVRAPLSVWLLIDDGLSRRVLPLEYNYLRLQLDRVAEARGMPLFWPRADAEGDYGVDLQLLWGGYTEVVAADGEELRVLVVAARREGPQWSTRLILEYPGTHRTWRTRDIDLTRALTEAMHQAVDEIATTHAIAPSDQRSWVHEIVVIGLGSGDAYARCMEYLQSLSIVDRVTIEGADPRAVRMVLTLNAAPEYLKQILAEDQVLEYGELTGHYVLQR